MELTRSAIIAEWPCETGLEKWANHASIKYNMSDKSVRNYPCRRINDYELCKSRRCHDRTDSEWNAIEPLLPAASKGRPWADHRTTLNGVLYWAATGVPWRDLPERFGKWQTVYERFVRWRRDGTCRPRPTTGA